MIRYGGRLSLQQRVIPSYRAQFLDLLAESCEDGLSILAGHPLPVETIPTIDHVGVADLTITRNRHFRDPQSLFYLCWQEGVIQWLKKCDPDALVVEANPRYFSTWLAIRWMKRCERPVLGWGLGSPRGGNPIDRFFRINFLQALDGVIAYSRRGADEYRAIGIEKVFVAHNAVSHRPKVLPPERPNEFVGKPNILFVGRLQTRKRIDILMNACALLPDELRPSLTIIGDGPARLEFETQAQKVYPQAKFTGAVHGNDLNPYFAAADLFALPGTGGLAAQQAMTHGLPLIVAKGDGTQDDLVRPENGWQVPPGDQDAFNAALVHALSDVTRLRKMGTESYRIVTEEINLEAMVTSFLNALTTR